MKLMMGFLCLFLLTVPAAALEIEAPEIPSAYRDQMPDNTRNFQEGLQDLIIKAVNTLRPDLREAGRISGKILAAVLLTAVIQTASTFAHRIGQTTGAAAVSLTLLGETGAMIRLAAATVEEISGYGKLLLPVMTTALAAQGNITTSGALYAGTAFFTALLQSVLDSFLVPGIYGYLALSIGSAATGEGILKRMGDLLKQFLTWCLKTLLIIFTSYLSLTHVISGTTDAAALKAAKVTVSSVVPVVGGILSDASEAVLVGAGLMKNAAGIYGILAVLTLFLHPFLRISLQYLILKFTGAIAAVFDTPRMTAVIDAFGNAMALLLAMTGGTCIMMLVSTVCFMRGVSG